jgi:hypothetical protein
VSRNIVVVTSAHACIAADNSSSCSGRSRSLVEDMRVVVRLAHLAVLLFLLFLLVEERPSHG